jgi:autotransporter adhesin
VPDMMSGNVAENQTVAFRGKNALGQTFMECLGGHAMGRSVLIHSLTVALGGQIKVALGQIFALGQTLLSQIVGKSSQTGKTVALGRTVALGQPVTHSRLPRQSHWEVDP